MSRKFMRTNTCGKLSQLLNIFERWFSHMYSYFVGIDIAKNTHWASCLSSDGEIILEPFSFSNDNSGFQKFISKLESLDKTKILIGLESTAHYGNNLIFYFHEKQFKLGIINPIQTATLRKTRIRKRSAL